jgi:phosphoglycolate phosphatase
MNIIFDLDGTLVDSFAGISHSFNEAIREILPHQSLPSIKGLIGPPIRDVFIRALNGSNLSVLEKLESYFRQIYDSEGYKMTCLYPGVYDSIKYLSISGSRCYVLTNKPIKPARKILDQLLLSNFITDVYAPDSRLLRFQSKKEAALQMRGILGLEPSKVLLVGDSKDDADAAETCGWDFAAITYGYGKVHEVPGVSVKHIINNFEEIKNIYNSYGY